MMEKKLKDWTFRELVDYWYGYLIMQLASANGPKNAMFLALDTAIRWHMETQEVEKKKK